MAQFHFPDGGLFFMALLVSDKKRKWDTIVVHYRNVKTGKRFLVSWGTLIPPHYTSQQHVFEGNVLRGAVRRNQQHPIHV